jgi:hypothetical protein
MRGRTPLTLIALALTATACNGGADPPATTTSATTGAPTTTTTTTATAANSVVTAPVVPGMKPDEIAVRNLIDEFQAEYAAALEIPDPARVGLLELTVSPYSEYLTSTLSKLRDEGKFVRRTAGGPAPHRTNDVTFSEPERAEAFECLVDDYLVYQRGNQQPIDSTTTPRSYRVSLTRGADAKWRVSGKEAQDADTTAGRCRGL